MRTLQTAAVAAILFAGCCLGIPLEANAQSTPQRLAIKNGESIDIGLVFFVLACRSIMIGLPEVEILEGPPQAALTIREEPVLPRRFGCATKVAGGTLVLTVNGVTEKTEASLTYRLKYKTKDGPRQTSHTYIVSLFP